MWAPNPFVVLLRKAQTDLAIRICTILVPIRLKKAEKKADSYGNEKLIRKWTRSIFFVIFSIIQREWSRSV